AALRRNLPNFLSAAGALSTLARPAVRGLGPIQRAGLAAVLAVALGLALLPESDAALEREIASLVERGDLPAARRRLDASATRRPGDPVVEKLRGDLACARRDPAECLRRYRVALAARPDLRDDGVLRANTRRLIRSDEACGTRRAAAHLLGELRDPEALPALEEARRSAGILAYLCTGDSIERAITSTRAELRP
ncbi:MAG TPA: serine/threonine protein kinase, partial [Anaeromyxobacter sp.]